MDNNITLLHREDVEERCTVADYASHVFFMNVKNYVSVEFNVKTLRIDGVCASNTTIFSELIDACKTYASNNSISHIVYADRRIETTNELIEWFTSVGFINTVENDTHIVYLEYNLTSANVN